LNDVNTGYKVIALVAVFSAIYSCSSSVSSQSERSTAAQLVAMRQSIDALSTQVADLSTQVAAVNGCSTESFLAGTCDGELPDAVSLSTTYCISQGRGVQLGAKLALEMGFELEGGGGWPNVLWGKGTAKATGPVVLATPPFILPSEMGGEASASLGKGLDICVDVPIVPTAEQKTQIEDLVRGVNVASGIQAKYQRRANRLLNYAARRTPVATANLAAAGALKGSVAFSRAPEEADDAFDIADEAVERFLANGFQPQARAADIMADPIFADLATSLDLPEQLTSIIQDPQQIFAGIQQVTPSTACATLGIDASLRSQHPQLNNICNRIANLPSDQAVQNVAGTVSAVRNRVNSIWTASQLRSFICDNVTLALLAPGC